MGPLPTSDANAPPALELRGWTVRYGGRAPALAGFEARVEAGRCLAVIGRSGAGKSSLLHSVLGLLPDPQALVGGEMRLAGELIAPLAGPFSSPGSKPHRDWLRRFEEGLGRARGRGLFAIFQEPRAALNPYRSVGAQLEEAARRGGAQLDAGALLDRVEIDLAMAASRPEALSVGMCQRVQVAMALALRARVVLADEPLARVDPRGRGRVRGLLRELVREGAALVLVTHDPELVEALADEVAMLHGGRLIARGPTAALLGSAPVHPLLSSYREVHGALRGQGEAWTLAEPEALGTEALGSEALGTEAEGERGCPLRGGCWAAQPDCAAWAPRLVDRGAAQSLCGRDPLPPSSAEAARVTGREPGAGEAGEAPLLELRGAGKAYELRAGWLRRRRLEALAPLDLALRPGELLACVGESGGGKTTLAGLLTGALAPSVGEALAFGAPLPRLGWPQRQALAGRLQLVTQEADLALDPAWRVLDSVAEAWDLTASGLSRRARLGLAAALLGRLGLSLEVGERVPAQLSGGERKRASLARGLAALGWGLDAPRAPGALILDEPLSGLDPVIQGRAAAVILEARAQLRLALLWISHDLKLMRALADRILVMTQGRAVELCERGAPLLHPFSRQLLRGEDGGQASGLEAGPGCIFYGRCDDPRKGPGCGPQTLDGRAPGVACWAVREGGDDGQGGS